MSISRILLLSIIGAGVVLSVQAGAHQWEGVAKDAWIDGKIESSYLINTELNSFKIDTRVEEGRVMLTGSVPSEAHKNLATAIAENIDGVLSVDNKLLVDDAINKTVTNVDDKRDFSTTFFDLTTTARLKTVYTVNSDLKAASISIKTMKGEVTLEGEVDTEAEKMLAEEIAMGIDAVKGVNNRLTVVKS